MDYFYLGLGLGWAFFFFTPFSNRHFLIVFPSELSSSRLSLTFWFTNEALLILSIYLYVSCAVIAAWKLFKWATQEVLYIKELRLKKNKKQRGIKCDLCLVLYNTVTLCWYQLRWITRDLLRSCQFLLVFISHWIWLSFLLCEWKKMGTLAIREVDHKVVI